MTLFKELKDNDLQINSKYMHLGYDYKQLLSDHVENIFKQYTETGLHICDIATGGGKSYTIGKLTCEYYPEHFDRIVILCVQNKLVDGMYREIEKFLTSQEKKITENDILVIENNPEVIKKAVRSKSFEDLLDEMDYQIGEQKRQGYNVNRLRSNCNYLKKVYNGVAALIRSNDADLKNEFIDKQINDGESSLRKSVRNFFETFKKHLEHTGQLKKASYEAMTKRFPALIKVYPQVQFRYKKVLLMTVHKALYGIDPILYEKSQLTEFPEQNKRTLILFDESDQSAQATRGVIIDQAIEGNGGNKRFANGYNGYLQYKTLIETPEHISNEYYGGMLEPCLKKANSIIQTNWERVFGKTEPYKSIFLGDIEDIEDFRRGVFFSGPAMRLNISHKDDKTDSFICYKQGDRHFTLMHSKDEDSLKEQYAIIVPLDRFLTLVINNTTAVKVQFRKVITQALENSRERFKQEEEEIKKNSNVKNHYLGYPTLEREIHTLLSRFETTSEYQYEQQLNDFITNRKSLKVKDGEKSIKLPDYSVYSQGVQLFQEEIDERDNQHRVRLSCREIDTTPEKIIVDLTNAENTFIVLCSATASSGSVVSNCDIKYLRQILGEKVHSLSEQDRNTFDDLIEKTYPEGHKVKVVPVEHYTYADKRDTAIRLPEKYKQMFSEKAREEGLDEEWFKSTRRDLRKKCKNIDDELFQLYRLFQFIEAYHWFITHDDIHSMIYFQNRTGDKDRDQVNVLSSLIDGSFTSFSHLDDEIPNNWENEHIRISKDWDEVEQKILSELSNNKDAKLMLVTAYGSFKAGTNMQYEIPDGLDYIAGDNWESKEEKLKKDWDAVFLQLPAGYLMMNDNGNESTFEKSLYNVMLTLTMLYERGCLSKSDVAQRLREALTGTLRFSEKNNPGIARDKAAWVQTVVEQAVGRLCRTRNKPHTTYILFDESMKPFIDEENLQKSLTKEFRTLAKYILMHPTDETMVDNPDEIVRCNNANYAQRQLNRMRRIALRYTPHPAKFDDFDDNEDDNGKVPHSVEVSQYMNQSYKQTIIRKPVISSLEELENVDKRLTFIDKCYGDWQRNENCEIYYSYDEKSRACPNGKGKMHPYPISPSYVRLDVLMKNPVIRKHFEDNGYATSWGIDGLVLHPQILATDYAGEIGEEAFRALVLKYTNCTDDKFNHLEGRYYELADFVIKNEDGSNKIAFDVKNMNPNADHDDKEGDMPTTQKRAEKERRLGCRLITVNMLQLPSEPIDDQEIGGMIDVEGRALQQSIERIQHLIND